MARFLLLHRDKISWISPLSVDTTTTEMVLLGGGAVAGVLLVALVILGIRRDLVTAWLIVPLAGIFLISFLVQPMLQARYLVCILPAAAIIAARVDVRAVAVLVLACLVAVGSWYIDGPQDDWRDGVAWLKAQEQPGDGILFSPGYGRLPFAYYDTAGQPIYPTPAWNESYMPGLRVFPPTPTSVANPRIWRIDVFGAPAPAEVLALLGNYRPVLERNFGAKGPKITLLERIPNPLGVSPPQRGQVAPDQLAQPRHLWLELGAQTVAQRRLQRRPRSPATVAPEDRRCDAARHGMQRRGREALGTADQALGGHPAIQTLPARNPMRHLHIGAQGDIRINAEELQD
jgi:hypothetical protein